MVAGIQDLSQDVLGYIFEHLDRFHRYECSPGWCEPDDEEGNECKRSHWKWLDLVNPSLFPCTIAHVSQEWRSVAARYSRFWTRFAYDLASPNTLLLDAPSWCQGRRFETAIYDSRLNAPGHPTPTPLEEQHRIQIVVDALLPHLSRCTYLQFDVFHSSSIPVLPMILGEVSKWSTFLMFESRFPTPSPSGSSLALSQSRALEGFTIPSFPMLDLISIDVDTLITMQRLYPTWWKDLGNESISLRLINYEFGYRKTEGRFTTKEFFELISSLPISGLDLRNLTVRPPFDRSHYPSQASRPEATLEETYDGFYFENLSTEFLVGLCSYLTFQVDMGTFKSCGIPYNVGSIQILDLRLEDLAPGEDLVTLLRHSFNGPSLRVTKCPSFNDDVLYALTQPVFQTDGSVGYMAEGLQSLYLEGCDSISIDGLKNMVTHRQLEKLELIKTTFVVTPDDVQWFRDRVQTFEYDGRV